MSESNATRYSTKADADAVCHRLNGNENGGAFGVSWLAASIARVYGLREGYYIVNKVYKRYV